MGEGKEARKGKRIDEETREAEKRRKEREEKRE